MALTLALAHSERIDRLIVYRSNYHTCESMRSALAAMVEPETWRRWGMEELMRSQHTNQGGPEAWVEVTRRVIAHVDPVKTADAFFADGDVIVVYGAAGELEIPLRQLALLGCFGEVVFGPVAFDPRFGH